MKEERKVQGDQSENRKKKGSMEGRKKSTRGPEGK